MPPYRRLIWMPGTHRPAGMTKASASLCTDISFASRWAIPSSPHEHPEQPERRGLVETQPWSPAPGWGGRWRGKPGGVYDATIRRPMCLRASCASDRQPPREWRSAAHSADQAGLLRLARCPTAAASPQAAEADLSDVTRSRSCLACRARQAVLVKAAQMMCSKCR